MSVRCSASIVLIHPPVVKPSEAPAGIARIAGALRSQGIHCAIIDANIEGLHYLLGQLQPPKDTWSRRAYIHLDRHIKELRTLSVFKNLDRYRRAVADISRLLTVFGAPKDIHLSLSDYQDRQLSPICTADLLRSFLRPERNLYFSFYQTQLLPQIARYNPKIVGISINYLSQALCAFALAGILKKDRPSLQIFIGGGLITSWMQGPGREHLLSKINSVVVDQLISGPGEKALIKAAGGRENADFYLPDYSDLIKLPYLSPGSILSYSASDGCWWRRCAFCPERSENRNFTPVPITLASEQIRKLSHQNTPMLIHILDNAISPALLRAMITRPPGVSWYGFVRFESPLDDLDFCHQLAASGCVMLKLGLESGSQKILDRLEKGICLKVASRILKNLTMAGISTYVYLLFGTPAEDQNSANETLNFVAARQDRISFLNLAIFNLPINSPESSALETQDFYDGDLALYRSFIHPSAWNRSNVRHFLSKTFKKNPAIRSILHRNPPVFTSNHAPFFSPRMLASK